MPLPMGYIDIHSHLIPGVDDGCANIEQSIECISQLQQQGFVGTICTPHTCVSEYPLNTPANIEGWTHWLRRELAQRGVDYPIWPGAELRLCKGVIPWLKDHGVPTLAGSRCVLVDLWVDAWPRWADQGVDYLLSEGYQPILAHPERINIHGGVLESHLQALRDRGVRVQGNLQCFTGEQGFHADRYVREFLRDGRYDLLAMDMHRPDTLQGRFDGMQLVREEFGSETLDRLLGEAPRHLILNGAA